MIDSAPPAVVSGPSGGLWLAVLDQTLTVILPRGPRRPSDVTFAPAPHGRLRNGVRWDHLWYCSPTISFFYNEKSLGFVHVHQTGVFLESSYDTNFCMNMVFQPSLPRLHIAVSVSPRLWSRLKYLRNCQMDCCEISHGHLSSAEDKRVTTSIP